jgi:hypothetical protein
MVVNSLKGVTRQMTKLAPNVITTTQAYWAALGYELDEEKAEEIALKQWWVEVPGLGGGV